MRLKSCPRPCDDRVPDRFGSTQSGPPGGNTELTGIQRRDSTSTQVLSQLCHPFRAESHTRGLSMLLFLSGLLSESRLFLEVTADPGAAQQRLREGGVSLRVVGWADLESETIK